MRGPSMIRDGRAARASAPPVTRKRQAAPRSEPERRGPGHDSQRSGRSWDWATTIADPSGGKDASRAAGRESSRPTP